MISGTPLSNRFSSRPVQLFFSTDGSKLLFPTVFPKLMFPAAFPTIFPKLTAPTAVFNCRSLRNYAPCGLSPQTDGHARHTKKAVCIRTPPVKFCPECISPSRLRGNPHPHSDSKIHCKQTNTHPELSANTTLPLLLTILQVDVRFGAWL